MKIATPTREIVYEISSSTSLEDIDVRKTTVEANAREAYERGYMVNEHEIVEALLSTGQKVTTTLTTEWRDK